MRKKNIWKQLLSLTLSGVLLLGSAPVSGEELFSESEDTLYTGVEAQVFSEEEAQAFSEEEEQVQDVPAEEDTDQVQDVFEDEAEEAENEVGEFQSAKEQSEDLFSSGEVTDEDSQALTEEEIAAQKAPMEELSPILVVEDPFSTSSGISGRSRSYGSSLPSRYDTRGAYTSQVKNQKPYGMCWAFTTAAGMETSLLMKGQGLYDLSEEHLAYFFANRLNDPLGNTANDKNIVSGSYREGGNQVLASLFLSTWSGMGLESQAPYPTDATHTEQYDTKPSTSLAYQTSAYLTDAVFSGYDVGKIKELIYQYGAVGMSLWLDGSYYDAINYTYGYPYEGSGANHAVTLVGWDDSFDKNNFPAASKVTRNGAWIAKNSWGSEWGDGGYFYISYDNKSNYNIVAEGATVAPAYTNNYFYDGSSALSSLSLKKQTASSGATMAANVFTATAGNGNGEVLGEVVLATHSDAGLFGIQVYTNLTNPADPTSGIPAYSTPVQFYQTYAGISTVKVPEVTLTQGSMYSVVITNLGSSSIDFLCETEGNYSWVRFQPGLAIEQSFAYDSKDGWSDLYEDGMCLRIKAHTRTLSGPVTIAAPGFLTAASASYKQINLSWSAVSGVSGYEIYRKAKGGSYQKLGNTSYGTTSYKDGSARYGVTYTYKVRAYTNVSSGKLYSSFSREKSAKAALAVPMVSVKVSGSMYNKVSWTKSYGAQGYVVYRKVSKGKWKRIATLKGSSVLSYKDKKISATTVYEYAVRAYRKINGKNVTSGYKSSGKYKSAAARQKVSSVTNTRYGLRIRWKTQTKCDGYFLYRREGKGKWKRIGKVSSGKRSVYFDNTVKKGKSYAYYARAYVKEPYGIVAGRYTKSAAVRKK